MLHSRRLLTALSKTAGCSRSSSFDISVALALFRVPLMAPQMSEVERKFAEISYAIEAEQSLKSDFELKSDRDRILLEKRAKLEAEGKDLTELDVQMGVSNFQLMDDWEKETQALREKYGFENDKFVDADDQPTSIRRKLDRKLMLLVRKKFFPSDKDYSSPWILPQLKNDGETLRQTAERCVGELFQGDVNVGIFGNAPFAHHRHVYPKKISEKTGSTGNMIFFYAAQIMSTDSLPSLNEEVISSYRWSTSEEIAKLVPSSGYRRCFDGILLE